MPAQWLSPGASNRAIQYFFAFRDYLKERRTPYKAIVAFSGEPEFRGENVSEASLSALCRTTCFVLLKVVTAYRLTRPFCPPASTPF